MDVLVWNLQQGNNTLLDKSLLWDVLIPQFCKVIDAIHIAPEPGVWQLADRYCLMRPRTGDLLTYSLIMV